MTALIAPRQLSRARMSAAEFRAFQDAHPAEKWQLVDGLLYAMAGGTMRHAAIVSNLAFALRRRLQGGPCLVFIADVNVVRDEIGFSSYPDVVVRCADRRLDLEREMADPTACFEVLSPTTRHLDQGHKLFAYHQMPTLKHVALIFPNEVRIESWTRVGEEFEETVVKRREDGLALSGLGLELPLAEIYEGVEAET